MHLPARLHSGVQKIGMAGLIVGSLFTGSVVLADIVSGLATTGLSNNVTITNLTIDKPADVAQGDVMIASIAIHDGNTVAVMPPAGWTLIQRTDNDTNIGIASYWKVAGASEPSNYSWSLSPQTRAAGGITRYSGVDTTNPIDASAGNIGRGIVATTSSITTSADNAEVIAVYALHVGGNGHAGAFFSTPSGMTEKYDVSKTAAGPTIASSDMVQVTAGTAGSKSSTIAGSQQRDWASQQIALRMKSPTAAVAALVVGGGGGGVGLAGGGGGGGGVVYETGHTVVIGSYAVTVGAGGAGAGPSVAGNNGNDSVFDALTAVGGGAGGQEQFVGVSGGSGGGGGADAGVNRSGGAGTPGQGNNGGSNGGGGGPDHYPSGGGGGAGAPGGDASGTHGGNGGAGVANSITGTSVMYGGGGGGVTNTGGGTAGLGGAGGGGAGSHGSNGIDGTPNTGGGGGAASQYNVGGSGGSGIVVISYPSGSMTATGGSITTTGGNTIHTFTSSATFTVVSIP